MKADIPIERLRSLFNYDPETGALTWKVARGCKPAGAFAGTRHPDKHRHYLVIQIDRRMYQGHRVIWAMLHGEWPQSPIDHVDGNGLNNRPANMRLATNSQNGMNRHRRTRGKYPRGVHYDPRNNRYYAVGMVNCKRAHIGTFKTAVEASQAYCAWATATFGEFFSGVVR